KSAELVAEDVVRLETAAMTAGKLYTLTVNEASFKFAGIAKVTGAPKVTSVVSTDVEEVVITFDKALDFETATNAANYTIADVTIEKAELDGNEVTLTTNGLAARKQYSVKVTNIKSIDGVALKSETKSFYTRPDTIAPSVSDVKAETNQRVVVTFSEKVNKETAENVANYTIKTGTTELEVLEAKLVATGDNKEKQVELTTEAQKASARYEVKIANIADQSKSGNVMSKTVTKYFYGMKEDKIAPLMNRTDVVVLSRNHIQVAFTDASKFDETTVLDANNYTITKNDISKADIAVEKVEKVSFEKGKYTVVLTVEDLSINSSYTVKAENITDEFENVLEKNNTVSVSVNKDSVEASTVSAKKSVEGNKIEITFTKPLNEATAEDIANYTIDGNIGTPVSATYKDKVVTLETINMTAGKTYEIKINGVEDLAGNVLNLSFKLVAAAGDKDETAPQLLAVYSVNEYVVAAEFDEAVVANGSVIVLKDATDAEITLTAKAVSKDGKVVEFSNYPSTKLTEDIYTVVNAKSFAGIKDKAVTPNALVVADITEEYTVYGNAVEVEAPEVLSVSQKNGNSFEMIMSKEVVAKLAETKDFKVAVDEDDATLVTFTLKAGKIVDGYEYKTNVALVLADKHGVAAVNVDKDDTVLYGEYKDEENPYIVNVAAKDRYTVEVEYSEEIGTAGTFEI
ncbi:MAG: Ig-like domain-containing protein, partial [Lutispora sp.]|nr:Ig-like domain-containing protein [Lutispora sp.]